MHELSLMTYLLEAVEKEAQQRGASKVVAINLLVGERAGIDDSLMFYFDLITPETKFCEGAKLHIRRTPMRFACNECNADYTPRGADFHCPECGVVGRLVDDATELLIESLEIEK